MTLHEQINTTDRIYLYVMYVCAMWFELYLCYLRYLLFLQQLKLFTQFGLQFGFVKCHDKYLFEGLSGHY